MSLLYLSRNSLTMNSKNAAFAWGQEKNWPWLERIARIMHLLLIKTVMYRMSREFSGMLLCEGGGSKQLLELK